MIKAWFVSLLLAILFALAYVTNIFAFLAQRKVLYFALGLLFVVLVAAFIILGNPLDGNNNDEKRGK